MGAGAVLTTDTVSDGPSIRRLVARAQAGDIEAFTRLYDHYVHTVYGFVYARVRHHQTAEDLTSEVFERALRNLDRFEWQGVDLRAWLLTIARNRITDYFKSARVRMEHVADEMPEAAPSEQDAPARASAEREFAQAVQAALRLLREDHQEVIELRFVHDLTVAETADVMGRSVGATKALQYRALKALATTIDNTPHLRHLRLLPGVGGVLAALRLLGVGR